MFSAHDIEKMNDGITGWNGITMQQLLARIDSLGIKHYKYSPNKVPLPRAFKSAFGKQFDLINRISYKMPRSAVFVQKGVSRGHPINNPRTAKKWFDPVSERLDDLAEIVADNQGNLIINALLIK